LQNIIVVKDLVVVYPDGTRAVDDITFSVEEGEFFGFLGPNGAGKSTTIKALTTLLHKASGRISVAGYDLDQSPREIRRSIGVLSQDTAVDGDLTGKENLRFQGRLEQMGGNALTKRVEELLKLVQLDNVAEKQAGRYSGGMKKRLDLASALIHKPRLLFLDEPTAGLDPQSRTAIWDYLQKLNKEEGVTIFLTTQNMEEADRLCRRISIIDGGKIIAEGSPLELKEALGGETITLSFKGDTDFLLRNKTKAILGTVQAVTNIIDSDESVIVYTKNATQVVVDVVVALGRDNVRPSFLSISSPTLDDVFLQKTGRRIRSEELSRKKIEPSILSVS